MSRKGMDLLNFRKAADDMITVEGRYDRGNG